MRTIFLGEKITIIAFEIAERRTKFTDYVLSANGIKMPNVAGDVQTDEAEHGITIKSTGNSLLQMIITLNYFSYN
jgi:translation elongation factor EF-G